MQSSNDKEKKRKKNTTSAKQSKVRNTFKITSRKKVKMSRLKRKNTNRPTPVHKRQHRKHRNEKNHQNNVHKKKLERRSDQKISSA